MDLQKYELTATRPRRADFSVVYFYNNGKMVEQFSGPDRQHQIAMAWGRLAKCVKQTSVDEDAFAAARADYKNQIADTGEKFRVELFAAFEVPDDKFVNRLFIMSVSEAGSQNYSGIYESFSELVDLVGLAQHVYGK